jgi:hypothetical protein
MRSVSASVAVRTSVPAELSAISVPFITSLLSFPEDLVVTRFAAVTAKDAERLRRRRTFADAVAPWPVQPCAGGFIPRGVAVHRTVGRRFLSTAGGWRGRGQAAGLTGTRRSLANGIARGRMPRRCELFHDGRRETFLGGIDDGRSQGTVVPQAARFHA